MQLNLNILIVHEVSYLKKVVYEYQDFAERLASRGHNVSVVDYDATGDYKYKKVSCSRTGTGTVTLENTPYLNLPLVKYISGRFNYKKLLKKKLENKEVDIVFLYSVFINGTNTIRLCKKYNIPVIYRVLDVYHKIRMNIFMFLPLYIGEQFIYRNADVICLINKKMISYVEKLAGKGNIRSLELLTHGVDTDFFTRREKDRELMEKYDIRPEDRVALFLGTTYVFSGLDVIIANFDKLKEICPTFKLIVVGGGDLDEKLQAMVKKNAQEKEIILTGVRPYDEVPRFLSLADITFNSFSINDITRDIIPIKILQYLACGKPVVSTPIKDVVSLFPEKQSGILYHDIEDKEGYIKLLGETINNDNLLKELSDNAIKHISNFSVNKRIEELEKLFLRTINNSK